jgi:hypothetical protein
LKPTAEPRVFESKHRIVILITLCVLEGLWFAWFLLTPLPNAHAEKPLSRFDLLRDSVPEVFVPGLKFDRSHLGSALTKLSHFQYLGQRLPIVLAAGFIAGSAIATGNLVLRALRIRSRLSTSERIAIGYGLGTTLLGVIILMIGRMGWISPWLIRIGLALPLAFEAICSLRFARRTQAGDSPRTVRADPTKFGLLLIVGPFLYLMVLGAMQPSEEFDSLSYHLQGPKEYFQAGRIAFLPHNVYTSMPFNVEMLHLLGMEVVNDWWLGALVGQLLIAGFAPASAVLIARTATKLGSTRAGWVAAVIYLTTPWIYRLALMPYVEGPLCYFHAALLFVVFGLRTQDSGLGTQDLEGRVGLALPMGLVSAGQALAYASDRRASVLSPESFVLGLLAGGAMATKYPGLISAVIPFGLWASWMSFRERNWRVAVGFVLGVGLVMTPWLSKNVIDTGNPVYPLGYKVFGASHWNAGQDAKWSAVHGPRPVEISAFWKSIVEVAGRSDWQSPLFLAMAPLAFLRRGSRQASFWLALYSSYLFLTWWFLTHRLDRFWLPILPGLAIMAGLGADWTRGKLWSVVLGLLLGLSVWMNATYCSTALAGPNEWTTDLVELRTIVPKSISESLYQLDNVLLPPGAKPLLVGQAAVFHLNRPIVYNTVFNEETIETLAKGKTAEQLGQELRKRGITHIYVDWSEINRYRSPGNYGFTPFVTTEFFQGLVKAGILGIPKQVGPRQVLYEVK